MQYKMTPLMWAATEGNEHMVKLLIDAKASTEAKDEVKGLGLCLFLCVYQRGVLSVYTMRVPMA